MAKTPLMAQYKEVKEKYRDCLLFYRLGDFYELFYDDALTASHELELTLTGKSAGQDGRVPMCGVPFHAAELYIYRLIQKGYKVAICEQLEDPKKASCSFFLSQVPHQHSPVETSASTAVISLSASKR